MTLNDIYEKITAAIDPSRLDQSLKFDCGEDGAIVLGPDGVTMGQGAADCTIAMTTENLAKLLSGKLNPMTGMAMGKLKLSGNPAVAMKFASLLKQ